MKNGGKNLKKTGYESEKSVAFLAEKIIENALNLRATDVHIEPREDHTFEFTAHFKISKNFLQFTPKNSQNTSNL
jgi:type II secretory ATPase GspE/PulE/Tfp pilus assembly ATPase PilB-like protein